MHIRLISPVTVDLRSEDYLREMERRFGAALSMVSVEKGPASIESEFDRVLSGPETVRQARIAEAEGCDAVIIDCMMDPALAACREAVSIPVLGPCETGMHISAMTGHRFSVIALLQRQDFIYRMLADQYGLAGRLASVRGIGIPLLELDRDANHLRHCMIEAAKKAAIVDGADTLLLGCTALENGARILTDALADEGVDVVVIEALPPTIGLAATLIRSGLAHGKGAFPMPPAKATPGYAA